jgi:hypothetical protein
VVLSGNQALDPAGRFLLLLPKAGKKLRSLVKKFPRPEMAAILNAPNGGKYTYF